MKIEECEKLVQTLLVEHKLPDWKFEFNTAKRRSGFCSHSKKIISLSYYYVGLNNFERVRNTILHEIAHALCGKGIKHGFTWIKKAIEIGCDGERYYGDDVVNAEPNYIYACPNCGKEFPKYKRIKRRNACSVCCREYNNGRWDERFELLLAKDNRTEKKDLIDEHTKELKSSNEQLREELRKLKEQEFKEE